MAPSATESTLHRQKINWTTRAAIVSLAVLACALVTTPGTLDVNTWVHWTNDYLVNGPVAGYAASKTDYPPLMAFIFYLFHHLLSPLGFGDHTSIKLTILFFYFSLAALIFYSTRREQAALVFLSSFFLNAALLGYSDVILGFFLLLSLTSLQRNSFIIFSLSFTVAAFIKWQALILAPFFALYLFAQTSSIRHLCLRVLLPAAATLLIIVASFGVERLWFTFHWALHHPWLSANAYNFPWLLTGLYQAFSPDTLGGLAEGEITFVSSASPPVLFVFSKILFMVFYVSSLWMFWRSEKRWQELLQYSLLGYLGYFVFNLGVHENHLFLAVLLAILLAVEQLRWRPLLFAIIILFNLNLLFSYGVSGNSSLPHVIAQTFDITFILACVSLLLAAYLWYSLVSQQHSGNAH